MTAVSTENMQTSVKRQETWFKDKNVTENKWHHVYESLTEFIVWGLWAECLRVGVSAHHVLVYRHTHHHVLVSAVHLQPVVRL